MKLSVAILSFGCCFAYAQQVGKKLTDVPLDDKVRAISVDRLGGFYVVGDCGIQQFDPNGRALSSKKYEGCRSPELLESWAYVRMYAYQNYKQQFSVLNSHLEEIDRLDIDPSFAVEPQLAAPSTDFKSYWIIDMDNSLKRVNIASNIVDLECDALKGVKGRFVFLREYQNLLFVLHEKLGIYVINKLGRLAFTIPVSDLTYFSFAGEDLYFLKGDMVQFIDIFTKATYTVKVKHGYTYAVATDERLVLIGDRLAEVFEFSPQK